MDTNLISQIMGDPRMAVLITGQELFSFSQYVARETEERIRIAKEARDNEVWLSTAETKKMLNVSAATLYRYAKREKLHPRRVGRALLYSRAEIQGIMNGQR